MASVKWRKNDDGSRTATVKGAGGTVKVHVNKQDVQEYGETVTRVTNAARSADQR